MNNRPRTRLASSVEDSPWILPVTFERDIRQLFMPNDMKPGSADPPTGTAGGDAPQGPSKIVDKVTARRRTLTQDDDVFHESTPMAPHVARFMTFLAMVKHNNIPEQLAFQGKYQYAYSTVDRLMQYLHDVVNSDNPRHLIQIILSDAEELHKHINELQWTVYANFSPNHAESHLSDQELALTLIKELVESFDHLRTKALHAKEQYGAGHAGASSLKPPKLSILKFSGNHAEWPAFKTNFLNLVRSLPDVDKLRMLVDAVRGNDAQDSVKDLALTSDNWTIAWKRITARYDSPREIAHAALRPLLEFPAMTTQSEAGLHKLIATVRTTKAQLKQIQLGPVTEAEVLYLHLIMGRLDTKTIHQFNQTLTTSDVPSLSSCIDFLEKQAKDVALVREIKQNVTPAVPKSASPNKDRGSQRGKERGNLMAVTNVSKTEQKLSQKGKKARTPAKPTPNADLNPNQNQGGSRTSRGNPTTPICAICNQAGHRTQACPKYVGMDHAGRKQAVQNARLCFSCLSSQHSTKDCQSKFRCQMCNANHHTSLHIATPSTSPNSQPLTVLSPAATTQEKESSGLVPTAKVLLRSKDYSRQVRCLLDTGASGCFITASVADQLQLRPTTDNRQFSMANGERITSSGTVRLRLSALAPLNFELTIKAHVLPTLLNSNIPEQMFEVRSWTHLKQCHLADPEFNRPAPVGLIIGLPVLDQLLLDGRVSGRTGQPSAHNTRLGYIIMGSRPSPGVVTVLSEEHQPEIEDVNFDLQKFWQIDALKVSTSSFLTPEEQFCEDHYTTNTVRLETGRYQIRWPFLRSPELLGGSYHLAMKRWISFERKLLLNPVLHQEYIHQLQEYVDLDQMELVPLEQISKTPVYYIPHHAVIKLSSTTTKLRIVFDASAKTTSGLSLNSLLPPGPTTQPDLFRQLLHFRENQFALKADVTKMYRQIFVHPDEQDLTRIVWRSDPGQPLCHYRMKVVPFGVTTAPFVACRTLQQLANDEEIRYPEAVQVLRNRFYVDDLGTSVLHSEEAFQLYEDLTGLLQSGGFQLRKWAKNSHELRQAIPELHRESASTVDMDDTSTIKTLGIQWSPSSDSFTFTCNPDMQRTHTKRNILSETSKVFDPLGLISPITIKSKILMQNIWKGDTKKV